MSKCIFLHKERNIALANNIFMLFLNTRHFGITCFYGIHFLLKIQQIINCFKITIGDKYKIKS